MRLSWKTTYLRTGDEVIEVLQELAGKGWLCRGQPSPYLELIPSIDRGAMRSLTRAEKLLLEKEAIEVFRQTARNFASAGEQLAMADPFVAMAVLRHYGVPSRVLDWTRSPWVAAFFAAEENMGEPGELWAFDYPAYEVPCARQWMRWPETTTDGSGAREKFDGKLTAFSEDPSPWFIVMTYLGGIPRQDAQRGEYTVTARFGVDHAAAISELFEGDTSRYSRFEICAEAKASILATLRETHGLWRGPLFPDTAGAADTARQVFTKRSRTGL